MSLQTGYCIYSDINQGSWAVVGVRGFDVTRVGRKSSEYMVRWELGGIIYLADIGWLAQDTTIRRIVIHVIPEKLGSLLVRSDVIIRGVDRESSTGRVMQREVRDVRILGFGSSAVALWYDRVGVCIRSVTGSARSAVFDKVRAISVECFLGNVSSLRVFRGDILD